MLREGRPHARSTRARVLPAGADADACVACTGGDRTVLCPQYPPACPPWVAAGACPDQARARACREAEADACVAWAGCSQAVRCPPYPPACPDQARARAPSEAEADACVAWAGCSQAVRCPPYPPACPDQARARAPSEAEADACVACAGSSQAVRCPPYPPAWPPWVAAGACPDQARARAPREAEADACVACAGSSQTMLCAPKPPAGGLAFMSACAPACTWPPPPPALCACGVCELRNGLRQMTLKEPSACMHKRGAAGRPGGLAPARASRVQVRALQIQDRGVSTDTRGEAPARASRIAAGRRGGEAPARALQIQDRGVRTDTRGAAGRPGGEAPARASRIAAGRPGGEAPARALQIQDRGVSTDTRGAAGGPGGEAPARASSIQVEFVPAFRQDIYDKYAQAAEASDGYATMREAAPGDEDEVQKYNNFVQAHNQCKQVWLDRFGIQAESCEATPGNVIAMGKNAQKTVVVCALIEIIAGYQVNTVGTPIDNTIRVAVISNLATSSSEEGRGHARKLITEIKKYAKNHRCSACALGVDTLNRRKIHLKSENIVQVHNGTLSMDQLQGRAQQQTLRVLGLYHRAGFRYQLQWQTKRRKPDYWPANDDPLFFFSNRHPRTGYIMVCWLLDRPPADMYRLKKIDDECLLDDVDENYARTWREEPAFF